jgi:hypothetical protein
MHRLTKRNPQTEVSTSCIWDAGAEFPIGFPCESQRQVNVTVLPASSVYVNARRRQAIWNRIGCGLLS